MSKRQFNIKLDKDLAAWLGQYCRETGYTKTAVVTIFLEALRAERFLLPPRQPNPFPEEVLPAERIALSANPLSESDPQ